MKDLKTFVNNLDELIDSLKTSGNQSSSYFESLKVKVKNINTDEDLRDFLDGVSKIGTIAQYGDFSPQQDKLLTKLVMESKSIAAQKP